MDAATHYRDLLAAHYTWMLGGDVPAVAAADRDLLQRAGVQAPTGPAVAVDLGCGPGPQTLALADLGFTEVIGIDSNAELLGELERLAAGRPGVRTVHGDLVTTLPEVAAPGSLDLAACMRDTLVHLPSHEAVEALLAHVATALAPGGVLALTYRDLTQELAGTDRFLPVRSDPDRIMMCVLDYDDPRTVTVTDVIYTRDGDGWAVHKSSYPKLRIGPDRLAERIEAAGLSVTHHALGEAGFWCTVAVRPA